MAYLQVNYNMEFYAHFQENKSENNKIEVKT
jgi:hypothetical protein